MNHTLKAHISQEASVSMQSTGCYGVPSDETVLTHVFMDKWKMVGEDGLALVGHLGHIAVVVVGVVSDVLGPAVRQLHAVLPLPHPGAVIALVLLEGRAVLVVVHTVAELEGEDLRDVVIMRLTMDWRSNMHHRGTMAQAGE